MADPAELYERLLVPALFAPFSGRLVELARCPPGGALLDVACGTGVVARAAAEAGCGRVVGLDIAAGMLARASGEGVEWVEGDAAALPFDDASFDAVTCGFGLGDPARLEWLFERSGFKDVETPGESRGARFASAAELALPYAAGLDEP